MGLVVFWMEPLGILGVIERITPMLLIRVRNGSVRCSGRLSRPMIRAASIQKTTSPIPQRSGGNQQDSQHHFTLNPGLVRPDRLYGHPVLYNPWPDNADRTTEFSPVCPESRFIVSVLTTRRVLVHHVFSVNRQRALWRACLLMVQMIWKETENP